ncbi:MAG: hypothetical protein RLZZ214_1773 [Verrucomicrobiota bacterium]|jgi:uncharacterized protein (DUF1800 family)
MTAGLAPICHATIVNATVAGDIYTPATWGTVPAAPPVAGNLDTWHSNGKILDYDTAVFYGNIFVLGTGAILQSGAVGVTDPGDDPTFQNFTFDGGTINYGRNTPSVFSFGTNRVTVTSAGGRVNSTNGTNRDLWFDGGRWKGSGELVFSHLTASDSVSTAEGMLQTFRFVNADFAAFTGTLTAIDKAILELTQSIFTPSFSLKLLNNARYDNIGDNDIAVRSFVIAGTVLPPGTYRVGNGSLSAAQEAFILTTGAINVLSQPLAGAFPDTNNNGFHDFVEISNPGVDFASLQNPELDSDGDGQTDVNEFIARTDPTERMSFIACDVRQVTGADVTVGFFGKGGVRYQLQWSPDMLGWVTFEDSVTGADADATVTKSFANLGVVDPRKLFFRMKVLGSAISEFPDNGTDSDGDGLTSAAEAFTLMFDPATPDSMRSAGNGGDAKHFRELLRGVNLSESLTDSSYASTISPENAARFLFQAGMGPREADIAAVQDLGYSGWIDAQLALPRYSLYATYLRGIQSQWAALRAADPNGDPDFKDVPYDTQNPGFPQSNLSTSFMRGVVHGDDILRQKSVWALLQIIVASGAGYTPRYGEPCSVFVDIFHQRCFGRYEDLLYHVSVNGHMGDWLTFINNKKANPALQTLPDENYAREIMQLFTIGLYEMNPDGSYKTDAQGSLIPTYDFEDVSELAKTFTGLKGTNNGTTASDTVNWNFTSREMVAKETDHDTTAKSLLNGYISIPANMGVKAEVRLVCEKLVKHPNCAPYVSTRLIQNLVTSNPTPAYVARISQVFTGSDGNLGQVIKAILLDPEARGPRFLTDPMHGKLREPMMRFTSLVRAFEVGTEVDPDPYTNDNLHFTNARSFSNQAFFESPSVFNFFESTYQESGEIQDAGLRSPEFQLLDATTNTSFIEQVRTKLVEYLHKPRFIINPGTAIPSEPAVQFRMLKEIKMLEETTSRDALVDRLSLLMTGGLADGAARADYKEPIFATGTYAASWGSETSASRIKYAVLKLFADSACAVQR